MRWPQRVRVSILHTISTWNQYSLFRGEAEWETRRREISLDCYDVANNTGHDENAHLFRMRTRHISTWAHGVALSAALLLAMVVSAGSREKPAVFPVHGEVLLRTGAQTILRTDAVPGIMPPQTRAYATPQRLSPERGSEIDAFLDAASQPPRLLYAKVAPRFVAGLPVAIKQKRDVGSRLPDIPLVDQTGRLTSLDAFHGKVLILSFVFTSCHDACPTISARFARLQAELDPAHFHLALVTIDPNYDSPAVLRTYGARFGARPSMWSLLTGEGSDIATIMAEFGVWKFQEIHNTKLVITKPSGVIASIISTPGWGVKDVVAQARDLAGLSSNPLRRFELAAFAEVVALCGGNAATARVVLESTAASIAVILVLGSLLFCVGRRIWVA